MTSFIIINNLNRNYFNSGVKLLKITFAACQKNG